ncbi:TetR/AcrR family transcriptional regulator [Kitasatospora sp. LaBMicrA B282]|uniref:TetR/AcrR family transcriptional regulator n=1 Tax=Kitasatospora sp. LaBMicrA B282 TaxID=3420949 RepID=UPI003D148938
MPATTAADRPAPGRPSKRERTRRAISDAAFRLFAERGFEAVRLAEVAEVAGVAPATLYAHFATKEDVFFARRDEFSDGIPEAVARAGDVRALLGGLERFHRQAVARVLDDGVLEQSRTFARTLLSSPALLQAYGALERERRLTLERSLAIAPQRTGLAAVEHPVFAALATAAANTVLDTMHRLLADGAAAPELRAEVERTLTTAFGRLTRAYEDSGHGG